jgi:hypothetical protein
MKFLGLTNISNRYIIYCKSNKVFGFYIFIKKDKKMATITDSLSKQSLHQYVEGDKKEGVQYAFTRDGVELPVVNVAHKAFKQDVLPSTIQDMWERHLVMQSSGSKQEIKELFAKSVLGRGISAASETFLDGMSTYLLKLGKDNLGSFATPIDRIIADALPSISVRLRLQHMANLLADSLASVLSKGNQSLHFVNIAGGTAMDCLNALILTPKEYLLGRKMVIHVFDGDTTGPFFGKEALTQLLSKGSPLEGLDIEFDHVPYNWQHTDELIRVIDTLSPVDDIIVSSSEGGLFEYGADEDIVANLQALHGHSLCMIGSVYRSDRKEGTNSIAVVPRTLDEFKVIVEKAGWTIDKVVDSPLSYDVVLRP